MQKDKLTIMFLSASPDNQDVLKLDKEAREIKEAIKKSKYRDCFQFIQNGAMLPEELQGALLDDKPEIVHFGGHGDQTGICLQDRQDATAVVQTEPLAKVFKNFRNVVRVVVLNSCYSEEQAQAIIEHIDFAIGMKEGIRDDAAIVFAHSLYRAIASGKSVQEAFEQGVSQIGLLGKAGDHIPTLLVRDGVNAEEVVLVSFT